MSSTKRTVTVDHSGYKTLWTHTQYYCMGCGKQTVYSDNHCDFYVGYTFLCSSCGGRFNTDFNEESQYYAFELGVIRLEEEKHATDQARPT